MSAARFLNKYGVASRSIEQIIVRWSHQSRVNDFLGSYIAAGVTAGDFLLENRFPNDLPVDIKEAFRQLMPDKAKSLSDVRAYVLEKIQDGPESLGGLFNTLQGRLGEFQFQKLANGMADLSTKTNQEGWDVVSRASGEPRYIQVKVYNDADGALEKLREVEEKLKTDVIKGVDGESVSNIDFAVNSEIYEELKEKAEAEGLATKVLDLGATREEIRGRLENMANEVDHTLEDFFSDVLGGVLAAGALHAIVNGFLVYNQAKTWNLAVEDSIYSSAVSGVGIATAATADYVIANYITFIGGPMLAVAALGAGISARSIARRIGDRRHFAKWLSEDNRRLQGYVLKFNSLKSA